MNNVINAMLDIKGLRTNLNFWCIKWFTEVLGGLGIFLESSRFKKNFFSTTPENWYKCFCLSFPPFVDECHECTGIVYSVELMFLRSL